MKQNSVVQRKCRRLIQWSWYFSGFLRSYAGKQKFIPVGEEWAPVINSSLPDMTADLMAVEKAAGDILAHRFDLLGSCPVDCSHASGSNSAYSPIEWNRDGTSSYVWPSRIRPWRALQTERLPYGADVKWPWELSRSHHLPHLAVCAARYAGNGNDNRAKDCLREILNQISDWIAANPAGVGVNWACEMDVAIRAVNWLLAVRLSGVDETADNVWRKLYRRSIRQHGRYLYSLLRVPTGKCGNHYVAELAGLYILGLLAPEGVRTRRWIEFAKRGLEEQIAVQVRGDGTHHEQSTAYHLLMTEMFLFALLIGRSAGDEFSAKYTGILKRMLDVLRSLVSSRGDLPRIGDDDSGAFIKPWGAETTASRVAHMLNLASQLEADAPILSLTGQIAQIAVCRNDVRPKADSAVHDVRLFDHAGWAVMRTPEMNLVMTAGAGGSVGCGHGHDDDLSFCLFWAGQPIIVAAGTGGYTSKPDLRNKFRSRMMHNAPVLLDDETSAMTHDSPFHSFSRPEVVVGCGQNPCFIQAEAAYKSYGVTRRLEWNESGDCLLVTDRLKGRGSLRMGICLSPGVVCEKFEGNSISLQTPGPRLMVFTEGFSFHVERGPYSPSYGRLDETFWLVCEKTADECDMVWQISERRP